ncbi:SIR2 family protein [Lysobacter yangpyeongensis]|uniref:SIR2 family protein n=1 Tax=Lysobacter yangpyeongensis TaxID=346182 RepID=A0ABW0SIT3_9GAMM
MNVRMRFIAEYTEALLDGTAAAFVGAGASAAAGYPDWKQLLRDIGDELELRVDDVTDLAALAQWSIQKAGGSRSRVQQVIDREIGRQRPVPSSLQTLVRLPLRHYWTTNYDELIERALAEAGRPYRVRATQADLSTRHVPGAAVVYKMHGTVSDLSSVVISTDDYELYRRERGAFLPLLQAQLTSRTFLFVGMSLTDPNVRQVLGAIRHAFGTSPPQHFAIARAPKRGEDESEAAFQARERQHQYWAKDLMRYGLTVIEVAEYGEIDDLLAALGRSVARRRLWISGSWPWPDAEGERGADTVDRIARALGQTAAELGLTLVSGNGQLIGSSSVGAFLETLQQSGAWDLERRLIARPFPQPGPTLNVGRDQWTALRREMAGLSGTVVFIGGLKRDDSRLVEADGVFEEYELARAAGAYLLPIGATGGAAAEIAKRLHGSPLPSDGPRAQRPSDAMLEALADRDASPESIIDRAKGAVRHALNLGA